MFRVGLALVFACALFSAPAAKAAPPIEAYGKLPGVEDVSLSPNGDRYAMIAVVGESRKLIVASADNKVILVAPIGNTKVRYLSWAGEDHVLVTVSSTKILSGLGIQFVIPKNELFGVIAINVVTHKTVTVLKDRRTVMGVIFGHYGDAQIDGHSYGYFGGVTYGTSGPGDFYITDAPVDLYRVDLDTGDLLRVAPGSGISSGWLVGPAGEVIARSTYIQRSGEWKVMSGGVDGKLLEQGNYRFGSVGLARGRTPNTVLVHRRTDDDDFVEEVPLAGGPPIPAADNDIIDNPLFDRATHLWIGYTALGDVPETRLFDAMAEAKVKGARNAFPDQSVRLVSATADFNRMIVFTSGGGDSGTYWLVDIPTHDANPIGAEYPQVRPADVGSVRMVDWKAGDGLALHGVLSLPPGRDPKNLPLVVLPHSGVWSRDYPTFYWWAQALASRGYAVFQPNFRGSRGYGTAFYNAGFGQIGRKMQTDISDGVAELARRGIVDPKRVCIARGGYGGYAALAGVTVQQGLYRCAVSVAGISNLPSFLSYITLRTVGEDYDSASRRIWNAMITNSPASVSPAKLASRADAPILLIHGQDDTSVPIDQSEEMLHALQAAGKPVEFVPLPQEDHFLSREATRLTMLKAAVAFIEKYNPPDPPPAAAVSAIH